jgi:hypothetical protein
MVGALLLSLSALLSPRSQPRVGRAFRVFSSAEAAVAPPIGRTVDLEIVHTATPDFILYAREAERVLKESFSSGEVSIRVQQLPVQQGSPTSFRILCDDHPVVTKRSDASGVALKMSAISAAITNARRRRRGPNAESS